MNTELLLAVKAAILNDSGSYAQGAFCGSKHCIAGFAVAIASPKTWARATKIDSEGDWMDAGAIVARSAKKLLGLNVFEMDRLCGMHYSWPLRFASRYERCARPAALAKVAADRIDHFIATGGAE